MSAPVASGSAAIIREYFMSGFYPSGRSNPSDAMEPSGVLVKAVILNGAVSLLGAEGQWWSRTTEDVEMYDDNQNFGRVNLLNSLPLQERNRISAKMIDRKTIQNGRTDEYVVDIDRSNGCDAFELSATLVWNDPASPPNCRSCLMNDLDLTISSGSTTVYANGRDSRDTINNSERVRVAAADGDRFTIRVEARNLETSSQKYALAITGCLADGTNASSGSTVVTKPNTVPAPTLPVVVSAPTPLPGSGNSLVLTTTTLGTVSYYGNMFNVDTGSQDILIESLGIHTSSTSQFSVQVYTKGGSLVGSHRSSSGWARIVSTHVQGQGEKGKSHQFLLRPLPVQSVLELTAPKLFTLRLTPKSCYSQTEGILVDRWPPTPIYRVGPRDEKRARNSGPSMLEVISPPALWLAPIDRQFLLVAGEPMLPRLGPLLPAAITRRKSSLECRYLSK